MSADQLPWVPDAAARVRIDAEYARIDELHAGMPVCSLCGQRTTVLDEFGLCPRVSDLHQDERAAMKAGGLV